MEVEHEGVLPAPTCGLDDGDVDDALDEDVPTVDLHGGITVPAQLVSVQHVETSNPVTHHKCSFRSRRFKRQYHGDHRLEGREEERNERVIRDMI